MKSNLASLIVASLIVALTNCFVVALFATIVFSRGMLPIALFLTFGGYVFLFLGKTDVGKGIVAKINEARTPSTEPKKE